MPPAAPAGMYWVEMMPTTLRGRTSWWPTGLAGGPDTTSVPEVAL